MKSPFGQRLTALLVLIGVVGIVAFGRARPQYVTSRASIGAPSRSLELPSAIESTPTVFLPTVRVLEVAPSTPLVDTLRVSPIYLHNRSLLL